MKELALVGCAHIHTPGFIKRIQARDDVSVSLVWDHDAERAEKCAAELDATVVSDPDEVWESDDIEAAVICSETDRHEPLVLAGADAGLDLFIEKPLGLGAADAYKMADAIAKAGVIFQTGYFQRGAPYNLFVKEQIAQGNFGQITRLRHSNCHSGSLGDWFTPEWLWMTDMAQAGVGAFGDLGTHSLDIMLWLLGEVNEVIATVDVAVDNYNGTDEFGEGLLKFKSGTVGSLAAGWVDVADPVNLLVSGTEGHAYVVNNQLYFKSEHVEGADGTSPWTDLPAAWPHAFELFLDAINGADVPLVDVHDAAYRSDVMEALYKSLDTGAWVAPVK